MSCPTVTYQPPGICRNSHGAAKYVAADLRVCDFCINTHSGATSPSRVNRALIYLFLIECAKVLMAFLHTFCIYVLPSLVIRGIPPLVILRNGVTKDLKTTINHKPTIINQKE